MAEETTLQTARAPLGLQLEHAEYAADGGERCAGCQQPLAGGYYEIDGRICCAACHDRVAAKLTRDLGAGAFLRAALAGLGAAILGAAVFWGVRAATGYNFSLISILVGFMVGKAVHWGARGPGGRPYQALAVLLTYLAIVLTNVPDVVRALQAPTARSVATVGAVLRLLQLLLVLPFLGGFRPLWWIVMAFGLYEAAKLNHRPSISISGPHPLAAPRRTT